VRASGPQSLGFYKKAYDLFFLPVSQLSTPLYAVAVPTLSRLTGDPDPVPPVRSCGFCRRSLLSGWAWRRDDVVGNDLILLLLGPAWKPSGTIFTFFGPALASCSSTSPTGWIHLSLGRADRWFGWGVAEFIATAWLFGFGLRWGPIGIAGAWCCRSGCSRFPAVCYAGQPAHLSRGGDRRRRLEVQRSHRRSPAARQRSSSRAYRSSPLGSAPIETVRRIAEISTLFGTLYLLAVILLHGGTAPLSQIAGLVRDVAGRDHRGGGATAFRAGILNKPRARARPLNLARPTGQRTHRCCWLAKSKIAYADCSRCTGRRESRHGSGISNSRRADGISSTRTPGDCVYQHVERYANNGRIMDLGCGSGSTSERARRDRVSRVQSASTSPRSRSTKREGGARRAVEHTKHLFVCRILPPTHRRDSWM